MTWPDEQILIPDATSEIRYSSDDCSRYSGRGSRRLPEVMSVTVARRLAYTYPVHKVCIPHVHARYSVADVVSMHRTLLQFIRLLQLQ